MDIPYLHFPDLYEAMFCADQELWATSMPFKRDDRVCETSHSEHLPWLIYVTDVHVMVRHDVTATTEKKKKKKDSVICLLFMCYVHVLLFICVCFIISCLIYIILIHVHAINDFSTNLYIWRLHNA